MKNYLKITVIFAFLFCNIKMIGQTHQHQNNWDPYFHAALQFPQSYFETQTSDGHGGTGSTSGGATYRTLMTYNIKRNVHATYKENGKIIKNNGVHVCAVQEIGYPIANMPLLKNGADMEGQFFATLSYVVYRYGIAVLWKSSMGTPTFTTGRINTSCKDGKRGYIIAKFNDFIFVSTHLNGSDQNKKDLIDAILKRSVIKNSTKPVFFAGDLNFQPHESPKQPNESELFNYIENYGNGYKLLNDTTKNSNGKYIQATVQSGIKDMIFVGKKHQNSYQFITGYVPDNAKPILTYSDHLPYLIKIKYFK
jgi:endonuclease/exonuclease/phosphatase family metal-dependent hydrolase